MSLADCGFDSDPLLRAYDDTVRHISDLVLRLALLPADPWTEPRYAVNHPVRLSSFLAIIVLCKEAAAGLG